MSYAIDIGAHFEESPWSQTTLVDQLRKRAFHCILALDRETSVYGWNGITRKLTIFLLVQA